jgi:putative colanic acid biosynthesis UDP-glucose lipid carrier transferase
VKGERKYKLGQVTTTSITGVVAVNIAFFIALWFGDSSDFVRWKITWFIANIAYFIAAFVTFRSYVSPAIHLDRIVLNAFKIISLHALFFFSSITFLSISGISTTFFVSFYALMVVLMTGAFAELRMLAKRQHKRGEYSKQIVIIGTGFSAKRLREAMLSDPGYGYKIMGYVSRDLEPDLKDDPNYIGSIDSLNEYLSQNNIDEIYYTLGNDDTDTMNRTIAIANRWMIQYYIVPQLSPYIGTINEMSSIGSVPVLTLRRNPLMHLINRIIKRGFDIGFSTLFLLISPIIFIPVSIAIKLSSPGPVFFRQKRTGYRGKEFTCLKFRTMRVNDESDTRQAERNDSRVTRVGNFLRRTSIDELPQFINVWLGDMSIVGPRPHMLKHTADYTALIDKYMVRHLIKPGITGWAQIQGYRGSTSELWQMEKRVECDVWYMENWYFMLDMKIIAVTIVQLFKKDQNAY